MIQKVTLNFHQIVKNRPQNYPNDSSNNLPENDLKVTLNFRKIVKN